MTEWTKERVLELLKTNDKAVGRALLRLMQNQTSDEQISETVKYRNSKGFRPCHGRIGTSMAKFFESRGYLTERQVRYWRVRDKKGNMRIGIYANQLLNEIGQS
jgi:hypothetical protein